MEDCLFRIYRVTRIYLLPKKARLGLAIATDVEPNSLILNEILSVGDESFRNKCAQKMEDFVMYYYISLVSTAKCYRN